MTYKLDISDAIMILENEKPHCGEKMIFTEEHRCEAYDMAIQALEQIQKGNLIDKADVCELFADLYWHDQDFKVVTHEQLNEIYDKICGLTYKGVVNK